jgi:hypothetical protein
VRVYLDLEHDAQAAPSWAVLFKAHGLEDSPLLFWAPTHAGLAARYLRCSKFGKDFEKWFATTRMTAFEDRVRSGVVHAIARRCAGYPKPEDAPLTEPGRVLDYLLQRLDGGARPVVNTSPSAAVLLARVAGDRGRSLAGVHFLLGAEPVTPARWHAIQASGAKAIPTYGTSETGWIGAQFPGVREPDTVHVFREAYAVIPRGDAEGSDAGAQPLLFTNLRPAGPTVLINAEIGDSAVIETGGVEGPAAAYGYDVRLHTIRSFRKVTVWGVTFAVADLEGIIEETLPARFGGAVGDYQLIEQQDDGVPLLRLLVSPTIGLIDEQAMKDTLLREVARKRPIYGFMAEEIRMTDTLRIERRRPVVTERGKVLAVRPGGHRETGA